MEENQKYNRQFSVKIRIRIFQIAVKLICISVEMTLVVMAFGRCICAMTAFTVTHSHIIQSNDSERNNSSLIVRD